jgi:hypothetical protein
VLCVPLDLCVNMPGLPSNAEIKRHAENAELKLDHYPLGVIVYILIAHRADLPGPVPHASTHN